MKVKTIVLGITCMLFLSMCNNKTIHSPERKSNIPNEAQWYGGKDGGVWILINPSDTTNHFNIEIYNENDGSLINKGVYALGNTCSDENLTIQELKSIVDAFDGEKILLQKIKQGKYCTLEPVK